MLVPEIFAEIDKIFTSVYPKEEIILVRNYCKKNARITRVSKAVDHDKVELDLDLLKSMKIGKGGLLLHNHNNGDVVPSLIDMEAANSDILHNNSYLIGIFAYKDGEYIRHAIRTEYQYFYRYRPFVHGISDHITFLMDILRKNRKFLRDTARPFSQSNYLDIVNFLKVNNCRLVNDRLPKKYDLVHFGENLGIQFRNKIFYVPKHDAPVSEQNIRVIKMYPNQLRKMQGVKFYEIK